MNKTKKLLISALLVIVFVLSVSTSFFAETIFTTDGYSYTLLNDGYISLYDWDGGAETLTIPNSLDNLYVKEIRNRCFIGRSDFSSIDFSQADYLNRIGLNAFKNTAITGELSIPAQVRTVASSAFENCDSIDILYYNALAPVVSSQCFYDCDLLKEVYLTDGVTTIESHAFSSCDILEIVRIPETVSSISSVAFDECPSLVIYCYTGSYAQTYAEENGIDYVLIDAPTEPTTPTEPATQEPTSSTEPSTEPATQEPTAVTEPSTDPTEPKAPYMLGDADNSGDIDVIDATFVQRYSIEAFIPCEDTIMQADVDSSGDVSSIDATFILRHLIHISVGYPIGEYVS